MKTYTIAQKMSGTGTIHDIASEHFDRDIIFRKPAKYAVVLAAYYGGRGYTTHHTAEAAIAKSAKMCAAGYSHTVIDCDGREYATHDGSLSPIN